ncbi:MAG: hypothetical protein IT337_04575, partial [Thermomicrobiales bacterium]|nr:hypothetical protein [Thermomicrobiales bacterium]
LRAGGAVFGVFIPMPSPEIVEVLALSGFDFALLDGEHGRIAPEDAYPMILAGEARGMQVMARVGQNERQVILKYLDLGVSGVLIPQTTTAADAERALAAMRYAPDGRRGLAGGRTFDYGLGAPMADLVPQINDRVLAMVQFEHIDSLPELEAMLALPGLDVLFVGPTDLAQSMGYPGQPNHPKVDEVIDEVCAAAQRYGVALGTVAGDVAGTKARMAQGFRLLVANAPTLLARSSRELLAGVRD